MFQRVHSLRTMLDFLKQRAPHYGPLVRDDLHAFRGEIVRASAGASIAAGAGLIFVCFLSVAVIVSAWDSGRRVLVAWGVCGWGILAVAGLWYARRAVSGPLPFRLMAAALARDYAHLVSVVERDE